MHGRIVAMAAPVVAAGLTFTPTLSFADRPTPATVFGDPSPSLTRTFDRTYSGDYRDTYDREDVDNLPVLEGNISTVRASALPPDPRVALSSRKLKPAADSGSFATALHAELTLPAAQALKVRKDQRAAVIAFYKKRDFKPVWTGDFGLGEPGRHILAVLAKADDEGLRSMDYLPASLKDFNNLAIAENATPSTLARLDLELTAAALDYIWDMTAGAVNPFRISDIHTLKVKEIAPADALKNLAATLHPERYLETLQPKIPQYAQLKSALAKYRKQVETAEAIEIPAGPTIRAGMSDDRLDAIARRLSQLGLYEAEATTQAQDTSPETTGEIQNTDYQSPIVQVTDNQSANEPSSEVSAVAETTEASIPLYGGELMDAVKAFQQQAGLGVDGVIGPRTLSAMNGQSVTGQLEKVRLAMERLRWLPRDLKSRHVFVNQAFFKTWMIDNGEVIFRSDVIIGKPKYQTAVFSDEMETVIFNPYWWVPRSIAGAEMLPRLRIDPTYLDRKGFEVLGIDGQPRSSASIDWYEYEAKTMPFNIRQLPGPANALGRVKFLFPNKHAIYMHDTPARSLFKKKMRAFSHGCVRVGKPLEFAKVIMSSEGWSRDQIDDTINGGERREVKLKRKIPVYLGYFTAWPDENGKVQFRDDVYGRDRVLVQALEQNTAANGRLALR